MGGAALGASDPEKSRIFGASSPPIFATKMFSGLMSRWTHALDAVGAAEAMGARERLRRSGGEELDALVEAHRRRTGDAAASDDQVERLALEPLEREERDGPPTEIDDVDVERPDNLWDRLRQPEEELALGAKGVRRNERAPRRSSSPAPSGT